MKNQYVSGIALLMLLAACQQEQISEQGTVENTGIRIQASISDQPESRTTAQTSGETTFDPNDEIGFFMPEEAAPTRFTYNTGKWVSETTPAWPNLTDDLTFCAFYPYQESATRSNIPMPDLTGQSGEPAELGAYDFLSASKTCNFSTAAGVVSFTGSNAFKHAYSLLQITLTDSEEATTLLTSASITGEGRFTNYAYRFTEEGTGEMFKPESNEEKNEWNATYDEGKEITDGTGIQLAVLLNPSDTEIPLDFNISYTREGVTFTAGTSLISHTFAGGYNYKYQIHVSDGELIVEGYEISKWNDGTVEDENITIEGTVQE